MIKILNILSNISYDVLNHLRKLEIEIQLVHGEIKRTNLIRGRFVFFYFSIYKMNLKFIFSEMIEGTIAYVRKIC